MPQFFAAARDAPVTACAWSHTVSPALPPLRYRPVFPAGEQETDGTVLRGPGSNAEDRRRTERAASHDGGCGCSRKRKRKRSRSGWHAYNYWTGELNDTTNAYNIDVENGGNTNNGNLDNTNSVVCRRQ